VHEAEAGGLAPLEAGEQVARGGGVLGHDEPAAVELPPVVDHYRHAIGEPDVHAEVVGRARHLGCPHGLDWHVLPPQHDALDGQRGATGWPDVGRWLRLGLEQPLCVARVTVPGELGLACDDLSRDLRGGHAAPIAVQALQDVGLQQCLERVTAVD